MLSTPGILPDRHDDNYWVARIMEGAYAENDLSSAIDSVLDKLLPSREFLIDRASDGGKLQLSIGWFFDEGNSGAVLGHSLFKRLSDFKIDLSFDVYPTHHAD